MGRDLDLTAQIDAQWMNVVLTAEQIRGETLRALAEAWAQDRDAVTVALDQLAAALPGPIEAWDSGALDFEIDLQMDRPQIELDETRALQLADELRDAAARTFAARSRANSVIELPAQHDRSAA